MSDTEHRDNQEPTDSPEASAGQESPEAAEPPVRRRGAGRFFRLLLWLVVLGGLGAGYWYYLQPRAAEFVDQYQQLQDDLAATQSDLQQTQQELSLVGQQLNQQQARVPQLQSALSATQNELASLAERLRGVETSRTGDWVVAEAQYLVRLANQKLIIGTDIASAVGLLEDADELLFELGYPEARRAREALASDIVRLEQVQEVDYQGIYFRIASLISLVNDLPLPAIESLEAGATAEADEAALSGWRRWWRTLVDRLEPFFVIRRDSAPVLMQTLEQLELQKLRVQLLLHEAQLGLMAAEQEIYRASLDQAAQLVETQFGETSQATSLIGQLRQLASRNVSTEVPEITASLRALQDLGDFLRNRAPAPPG